MRILVLTTIFSIFMAASVVGQHDKITAAINSPFDEQNPVVSPDAKHLFYTIAHNEQNVGGTKDKGDIWYSVWLDSSWSKPFHAGTILNTSGWNGVIGYAEDGSLYLHHHYSDGKQGISMAKKSGGHWKKPRNVSIPYFVNKSEHQSGCVASNGQVMLLSLQSYGSMGAEDIYVSFKNRDKWTEPRNIGSVVNTKFQEMTPVLAKDNKTLFFSSNGHSGAGSMDIFRTTRLDDTWLNWSRPENVKEVNSSGREHSFSYDPASNLAQFVTTQDSDGYGDIRYKELEQPIEIDTAFLYVMREPTRVSSSADGITITVSIEDPKTLLLHGLITDKKSKAPIKANLTLTSVNNNSAFNITSDSVSGAYNAVIKSKGKYRVKIEAKGYLTHMEELDINADIVDDPGINYSLDPIKVGEAIKLEHVLFERGTINLLPSSYDDLDGVVELLKDNPTMEIELAGHTDNQGSSKLNMKLSQDRVDVVKKYMVKKGVASRRITGKGYGGTRPVASNKNPVTRKLNRRVEFILVKE